jgi:hypothetical protein
MAKGTKIQERCGSNILTHTSLIGDMVGLFILFPAEF